MNNKIKKKWYLITIIIFSLVIASCGMNDKNYGIRQLTNDGTQENPLSQYEFSPRLQRSEQRCFVFSAYIHLINNYSPNRIIGYFASKGL